MRCCEPVDLLFSQYLSVEWSQTNRGVPSSNLSDQAPGVNRLFFFGGEPGDARLQNVRAEQFNFV